MEPIGILDKLTPLITTDCILDYDMGLINLVLKEYFNRKIFTMKDVKDYNQLIAKIYYRKNVNPLREILISQDKKYQQFVDEAYQEFISEKMEDILSNSITTEILDMAFNFIDSGEIVPTIVFFSDLEYETLQRVPNIEQLNVVNYFEFHDRIPTIYNQYFIKSIEQLQLFTNVWNATFYISSCGINLNEENQDLRDVPLIVEAIRRDNQINIVDLYRSDIIGRRTDANKDRV